MNKAKVTIELTVSEGNRIKGWGESAEQEYILKHPQMKGDLRFICQRREVDAVLEQLTVSQSQPSFALDADVSLVDVGDELARSSTGVPLSQREKEELRNIIEPKQQQTQQDNPFKIKIG